MKRHVSLLLIFILLVGLCACGTSGGSLPDGSSAAPDAVVSGAPLPSAPDTPAPSGAVKPGDTEWQETYLAFLSENYDELCSAFVVGIAGLGFVDLDLDGVPEMLIFDSGASASMGVQFFDIADGAVTCVSANLVTVAEAFGGEYLVNVYVNANYLDAFRLKQGPDGAYFFCVESGNGAIDFGYTELIRFGGDNGVLTLSSVLYRYEEFDEDTGDVVSAVCTAGEESIDLSEYETRHAQFFKENADCGYTAAGAFVWEDKSFDDGYDGFLAMTEAALALYVPAVR